MILTPSATMATLLPGACADLPDPAFLLAIESTTLPPERFRHADHVRLAWLYLRSLSLAAAVDRLRATIRGFAIRHAGDDSRYHETITRAHARLVAAARAGGAPDEDFAAFAARNPDLFDRRRLGRHYSAALLTSPAARAAWVEPDLDPLPAVTLDPSALHPDRPCPCASSPPSIASRTRSP